MRGYLALELIRVILGLLLKINVGMNTIIMNSAIEKECVGTSYLEIVVSILLGLDMKWLENMNRQVNGLTTQVLLS